MMTMEIMLTTAEFSDECTLVATLYKKNIILSFFFLLHIKEIAFRDN